MNDDVVPVTEATPAASVSEIPAPPPDIVLELALPRSAVRRVGRTPALTRRRVGRSRTAPVTIEWHETAEGHLSNAPPVADPPAPAIARLEGTCRDWELSEAALTRASLLEGGMLAGSVTREVARLSLRGAPAAVFDLARTLLDELPLSVPAASLTDEVRAALHGPVAPHSPRLRADLDVDEAFAHVVAQLAAAILHHAPGARLGQASEPVHQMRVALRRLRSAMALFGRAVGCPELDRSRQALAGLARALGPARDWDVFLGGTGRQIERLLPLDPAVVRLTAAARRRRKAAYASLGEVLDGKDFQRTLLDLLQLAAVRPWRGERGPDQPRLTAFARHALDRRLRRVAAAGADLDGLPIPELHQLRIGCKRLRYAAEFFAPMMPGKQTRRFLRRLAAVQERLGHLNDGAVAAGLLAELNKRGFAAGIVQGYLLGRHADGRAKAARSWRRFREAAPFWH